MKKIFLIGTLFVLLLTGCNPSGINDLTNKSKITRLQDVIDGADAGDKINLADYSKITDYNATINKKLTIYNGKQKTSNSTLTVSAEGVEIVSTDCKIVTTPSRSNGLKIANSNLSSLSVGTNRGRGVAEAQEQEGNPTEATADVIKIIGDNAVDSLSINADVAIKVEASNKNGGSNITLIDNIADSISVTFHCLAETGAMFQLQLALGTNLNKAQISQDLTIAEVNADFKYFDDNYDTGFGEMDQNGNIVKPTDPTPSTTIPQTTSTTVAFSQGWPTTQIAAIEAKHNNFGKISDVTCTPPGIEQGCYYITDNENFIYVFLHNIDEDTASTYDYIREDYAEALKTNAGYEVYVGMDGEDDTQLACSSPSFKALQNFVNLQEQYECIEHFYGAFGCSSQNDVSTIVKYRYPYKYSQLLSLDIEAAEEQVAEIDYYLDDLEDEDITDVLTALQSSKDQPLLHCRVMLDNTEFFEYNPIELNETYTDFEFDRCIIVGLHYIAAEELQGEQGYQNLTQGDLVQKLGWLKAALKERKQ